MNKNLLAEAREHLDHLTLGRRRPFRDHGVLRVLLPPPRLCQVELEVALGAVKRRAVRIPHHEPHAVAVVAAAALQRDHVPVLVEEAKVAGKRGQRKLQAAGVRELQVTEEFGPAARVASRQRPPALAKPS